MAKYQYVGPEETRGHIPSWGFDDGVLDPAHLASLLDRGQVVLLDAAPALDRIGTSRAEGIAAAEPAAAPKPRSRKRS
jgi:hypothetical protein